VKVEQKGMCNATWVKEKRIKSCGVFYLIDANLHIHICSFTPSLEGWPVQGYATFEDDEAYEADQGEVEREMMATEEGVSYFGLEVLRNPWQPLDKYLDIPEQEEDEDDEDYRRRVADLAGEYFSGNPMWFTEKTANRWRRGDEQQDA